MTVGWTLAGSLAQLMLALFLFMMVVFSAAGIGNGVVLGKLQLAIFNLWVFVLPALCVVSAGVVVYLHMHGAGASSYWWYAMPLAAAAVYFAYAVACAKNGVSRYSASPSGKEMAPKAIEASLRDGRPD
jgi:hypothetical protein